MIPAHFIWYQGDPPDKYKKTIADFRIKNPSFQIYIWDHHKLEKLISNQRVFINAILNCEYMIQKIDIYKYAVLYYYGGIYLDLDIQVENGFTREFIDFCCDQPIVFSYVQICEFLPFQIINNGIIFGKKGSPKLLKIVDEIQWNQPFYKTREWKILDTTGPFYTHQWAKKNNILILDNQYVEGRPILMIVNSKSYGLFITHLHHNNWMDSFLFIFIYLFNQLVFIFIIFITIYTIVKILKKK